MAAAKRAARSTPASVKEPEAPALSPPAQEGELEAPESAREAPEMDQDDLISENINSEHKDSNDDKRVRQ